MMRFMGETLSEAEIQVINHKYAGLLGKDDDLDDH